MDDSCAVCAETLQWVAYGPCGHREVCSTCIVRLRFICSDYHCCICKSISNVIFVTKALGDYTRIMDDFSVLPVNPAEGQVGSYWYHEGTKTYFDDLNRYKMVKAMCRLSCSVCDKIKGRKSKGTKRTAEFKNIEQLESHLFQQHRLFMCSLCLEGRKVFIWEQKLYNKEQLDQHNKTGDPVIDGNECERGGFMGHPMCEFCQNPFYGDNELYSHMSTEHYTCHICQSRHTGQYEYYKDYDDLEIHFRGEHFLCEDQDCLEKKFIVFATESEMKRHNAAEHKGRIPLSRRYTVPQMLVSFRHHLSNGNDGRDREERGYYQDSFGNQSFWANNQPTFRTVIEEGINNTSSRPQRYNKVKMGPKESNLNSFDMLATLASEPSLRCNRALDQNSRNVFLEESSFPPLPPASRSSRHESEEIGRTTMAAHFHRRNHRTVSIPSYRAHLSSSHQHIPSASSSHQSSLAADLGSLSYTQSPSSSLRNSETVTESTSSAHPTSSRNTLANGGSSKNSISKVTPVTAAVNSDVESSSKAVLKMEDGKTANKLVVEKIRASLGFDDNKFAAFREASVGYRRGTMSTGEFFLKMQEFNLAHLVLEVAVLCPDAQKQKELIETYNSTRMNGLNGLSLSSKTGQPKKSQSSSKGKEKCENSGMGSAVAHNSISCLSDLQTKCKLSEGNIISEKGCNSSKGKSKVSVVDDDEETNNASIDNRQSRVDERSKDVSGNKPKKRMPKFLRNRLGNAAAAVTDLDAATDAGSCHHMAQERADHETEDPPLGQLAARGVWSNGGGRRLVVMTRTQETYKINVWECQNV